jgi:hypothetical protein
MTITDADVKAAEERYNKSRNPAAEAVAASYDKRKDRIVVALANGAEFSVPPSFVKRLKDQPASVLGNVEVSPSGRGLHWPEVDEDLYVPALIQGVFGSKTWMAGLMGKAGGQARSKAKTAAARENGKRGGRPRKKQSA